MTGRGLLLGCSEYDKFLLLRKVDISCEVPNRCASITIRVCCTEVLAFTQAGTRTTLEWIQYKVN